MEENNKDINLLAKLFTHSLRAKVNIILALILFVICAVLTSVIYNSTKNNVEKMTDENMHNQLYDLKTLLQTHVDAKQSSVNIALNLAHELLYSHGNIVETNENITVQGINQQTKAKDSYRLPVWKLGNTTLFENFDIVDNIKNKSVETATIFQKIQDGYLRISTNVLTQEGKRATGTFIPNSSEVIKTIEKGETYYGRALVVGNWYLTAYEPITINGEVKGILYVGVKEMDYDLIKSVFTEKSFFEHGYPFLIDAEGTLKIHPKLEGENFASANFFNQILENPEKEGKSEYLWPEKGDSRLKLQYYTYFAPYDCYISTSIYEDDMYAELNKLLTLLISLMVIGSIVIFAVLSSFLNPIINELVFLAEESERIANGELSSCIEIDRKDELGILQRSLCKMVHKLKNIVADISSGATQLNSASDQFNSAAQTISQSATEQASSVEELSSTLEEMVAQVTQNTDNAKRTEDISTAVANSIKEVNSMAQNALQANEIIAKKVDVITEIAKHTNILSLNASIEAAKAGEHGKGFTIVASEVRELAEQSQTAASEIVQLAKKSVEATKVATENLKSLIPDILKTNTLVQEISTAGYELNNGFDNINQALQQINQTTTENASSSEEMACGTEELSAQSRQLMQLISFFNLKNQGKTKKSSKKRTLKIKFRSKKQRLKRA